MAVVCPERAVGAADRPGPARSSPPCSNDHHEFRGARAHNAPGLPAVRGRRRCSHGCDAHYADVSVLAGSATCTRHIRFAPGSRSGLFPYPIAARKRKYTSLKPVPSKRLGLVLLVVDWRSGVETHRRVTYTYARLDEVPKKMACEKHRKPSFMSFVRMTPTKIIPTQLQTIIPPAFQSAQRGQTCLSDFIC